MPLEAVALGSNEFNGVLADWKEKVLAFQPEAGSVSPAPPPPPLRGLNPAELSVLELVGALRPVQLWSVTIALAGLLAGAFSLGARLLPFGERPKPAQGVLRPVLVPGAVECPCRSFPPDTPGRSSA